MLEHSVCNFVAFPLGGTTQQGKKQFLFFHLRVAVFRCFCEVLSSKKKMSDNKKRLTAEEALELFWSLPENSNNSDDEEFESSEDEVWDLPPDESSENESDVENAPPRFVEHAEEKTASTICRQKKEKKEKCCFESRH
ncbi:hypothetical protein MRX96_030169 [Rhipicephalus microplus]